MFREPLHTTPLPLALLQQHAQARRWHPLPHFHGAQGGSRHRRSDRFESPAGTPHGTITSRRPHPPPAQRRRHRASPTLPGDLRAASVRSALCGVLHGTRRVRAQLVQPLQGGTPHAERGLQAGIAAHAAQNTALEPDESVLGE
uniref:(northern house mosquito) hypothetical protein n=1 Tax=Culex pipiens TaxID=7175 RepID=A0A8D8NA58_CULPI